MTTPQIIIVSLLFILDFYCSVINPIMKTKDNNMDVIMLNVIRICLLYVVCVTAILSLNEAKRFQPKPEYKLIEQNVYIKN